MMSTRNRVHQFNNHIQHQHLCDIHFSIYVSCELKQSLEKTKISISHEFEFEQYTKQYHFTLNISKAVHESPCLPNVAMPRFFAVSMSFKHLHYDQCILRNNACSQTQHSTFLQDSIDAVLNKPCAIHLSSVYELQRFVAQAANSPKMR